MIQVTYQKRNGSLIQRIRNTMVPYKIGETTSMGWKVINIEFRYDNAFYSEQDYYRIIQRNKKRHIRKQQIKKTIIKESRSLFYYFIMISILYFIRIRIGI